MTLERDIYRKFKNEDARTKIQSLLKELHSYLGEIDNKILKLAYKSDMPLNGINTSYIQKVLDKMYELQELIQPAQGDQ